MASVSRPKYSQGPVSYIINLIGYSWAGNINTPMPFWTDSDNNFTTPLPSYKLERLGVAIPGIAYTLNGNDSIACDSYIDSFMRGYSWTPGTGSILSGVFIGDSGNLNMGNGADQIYGCVTGGNMTWKSAFYAGVANLGTIDMGAGNDTISASLKAVVNNTSIFYTIFNAGKIIMGTGSDRVYSPFYSIRNEGLIDLGADNDVIDSPELYNSGTRFEFCLNQI